MRSQSLRFAVNARVCPEKRRFFVWKNFSLLIFITGYNHFIESSFMIYNFT